MFGRAGILGFVGERCCDWRYSELLERAALHHCQQAWELKPGRLQQAFCGSESSHPAPAQPLDLCSRQGSPAGHAPTGQCRKRSEAPVLLQAHALSTLLDVVVSMFFSPVRLGAVPDKGRRIGAWRFVHCLHVASSLSLVIVIEIETRPRPSPRSWNIFACR